MFTVIARTHNGKTWEQTYIDGEYAVVDFYTAVSAVDCASVDLVDATTGEVYMSWDYSTKVVSIY